MKEEYQEELKRTGEKGIEFDIKPLISAITLDDFQVNWISHLIYPLLRILTNVSIVLVISYIFIDHSYRVSFILVV